MRDRPGYTPRSRHVSAAARIAGIDYALPETTLTNEQLEAAHPEWGMSDVAKRTGVLSRHIAGANETALDLATRAAESLLSRGDADASAIDALIFCTETPDHVMPPNACLLQARLGLRTTTAALDFTLACSGYVYGLYLAKSLIVSGAARNVLLATGDTYSKLISPDDRATVTLFGDGAAATLITSASAPGIGDFELGTDGSRGSCFIVPAGGARQRRTAETAIPQVDRNGNRRSLEQIQMDGAGILGFVQREIPRAIRALLTKAEVAVADVDLVVFHQASITAVDYLTRALKLDKDRVFVNMAAVANTVSASIPIALRDAETAGRLQRGDKVLIAGFGVGLSWGACLIDW